MIVETGIITTIAGTGTASYSDDNGPATAAELKGPLGVSLDSAGTHSLTHSLLLTHCFLLSFNLGNVYISDTYNCRIRKVTISTGIITTFAGTGAASYSGDNGQASSASLYNPQGLALDFAGTYSLYLAYTHFY